MRRLLFVFALYFLAVIAADAREMNVKVGEWVIAYNNVYHTFSYSHRGKPMMGCSRPEAVYTIGNEDCKVSSSDFSRARVASTDSTKSIVLEDNVHGDGVSMTLEFLPWRDALQTRLLIQGKSQMASNYMVPLHTVTKWRPVGTVLRMLKVPFDNDGFSRYEYNRLSTEMTSYEVTAVFDGITRNGLIVGSVDHAHWKSAVDINACGDNTVTMLKAYSGVSTKETHDLISHGKLVGTTIASAWMMIADAADWREGMELFAEACVDRQPRRNTWKGGTPVGWQSWGVMSTHNSMKIDTAISDYYATELRKMGFCGENGVQIMSIDAWDNLSSQDKYNLTAHCEKQGQIAGIYRSPFSLWWDKEESLQNPLYAGCEYKAYDCVLKANGKPFKYDGAFCLDPTHPATKEMMRRDMEEARNQGFRYVKVDFVTNGILQADSYYNKNVHTAVEAYNEGFSYFADQCYDKDGQPMFIALSISPIFPYQYGNSRRIACDTWGKIGQSEYAMNAICGGWWTNTLFQHNDPDHIVLIGNDDVKETEGENRARLTTGFTSGMLLLADNYDINDTITKCGDPKLSVERAQKLLSNPKINALIGNVKHSFRPLYGYRPFDGKASSADNFVTYEDDEAIYIAIVNYSESPLDGVIDNNTLGLADNAVYHVEELWTGEFHDNMRYNVPGHDARIYKIKK